MKKIISIVILGLIITSGAMAVEEVKFEIIKTIMFMRLENILID